MFDVVKMAKLQLHQIFLNSNVSDLYVMAVVSMEIINNDRGGNLGAR
jgi:hypothetical protein